MTILTAADLPIRATMWHDESIALVGSAFARVVDTLQEHCSYTWQSTGANGDTFTQSCFLRSGNYTLSILGETVNDQGKVDIYLDGALAVSAQDWYSLVQARNVVKTAAVVVASDGRHVLRFSLNGCNGAAVAPYYNLRWTKIWLAQASD